MRLAGGHNACRWHLRWDQTQGTEPLNLWLLMWTLGSWFQNGIELWVTRQMPAGLLDLESLHIFGVRSVSKKQFDTQQALYRCSFGERMDCRACVREVQRLAYGTRILIPALCAFSL